uniref:Uncharacterized protein n=1 Tax=Panagrolaimus davidi TaxID=227884 RepID=A0A914PUD5_9BILA
MVVLTVGVVATIATAGAAGPAVAAAVASAGAGTVAGGAATGVGVGAATGMGVGFAAAAAGGATAASAAGAGTALATAAGAAGAASGAMVAGATGTALIGASAAGAASSAAAASTALGIITGPIGWVVLGCDEDVKPLNEEIPHIGYTFDCWKKILREESPEPSNGILLKDIVIDSRIKSVQQCQNDANDYPAFIFENIWNEKFFVNLFSLPNGQLVAHADLLK